jgi:hypothetical protein
MNMKDAVSLFRFLERVADGRHPKHAHGTTFQRFVKEPLVRVLRQLLRDGKYGEGFLLGCHRQENLPVSPEQVAFSPWSVRRRLPESTPFVLSLERKLMTVAFARC